MFQVEISGIKTLRLTLTNYTEPGWRHPSITN